MTREELPLLPDFLTDRVAAGSWRSLEVEGFVGLNGVECWPTSSLGSCLMSCGLREG